MQALVAARLPAMYARLGDPATLVQQGQSRPVQLIVDQRGGTALDGMALLGDVTGRLQAADAPAGVARNDLFVQGGVSWVAREAFQPTVDGLELQGPLQHPE